MTWAVDGGAKALVTPSVLERGAYRRNSFCGTAPLDLDWFGSAGRMILVMRKLGIRTYWLGFGLGLNLPLSGIAFIRSNVVHYLKYNTEEDRKVCKIQFCIIVVYIQALDEIIYETLHCLGFWS